MQSMQLVRPLVPLLGRFDAIVRLPESGGAGGAVFVEVPRKDRTNHVSEVLERVYQSPG